jgi:hypothetical protein
LLEKEDQLSLLAGGGKRGRQENQDGEGAHLLVYSVSAGSYCW